MDVGGQAVIEGVMMRNKQHYAVAVRTKDDKIEILKEKSSKYPKYFQYPFIRGVIGLGYTLYDGIRALIWSSNQQLETDEKITKKEAIMTIVFSMLFAIVIFVVVPFFSARYIQSDGIGFDMWDGAFRFLFFFGYLLIISRMKDVQTLFKYHGAEHKSIACYEAKEELTIKNARKYSRFHPRCGTSFLLLVMIISVLIFTLIPGGWVAKLLGRIVLMPVIAGIAYEAIKLSGRYNSNMVVKTLIAPGLWLQRITTKEPSDAQLEVGLRSLKAVLEA